LRDEERRRLKTLRTNDGTAAQVVITERARQKSTKGEEA